VVPNLSGRSCLPTAGPSFPMRNPVCLRPRCAHARECWRTWPVQISGRRNGQDLKPIPAKRSVR